MRWVTELLNVAIQCPCGEQRDVEENYSQHGITYGSMFSDLLIFMSPFQGFFVFVASCVTFCSVFVHFKNNVALRAHFPRFEQHIYPLNTA